MSTSKTRVWMITDGVAGHVQQARGLYQAIVNHHKKSGHPVVGREYKVSLKKDFAFLPAALWPTKSTWFIKRGIESLTPNDDLFKATPPDIIIGTGRRSAPLVAALKRKFPTIFAVQLMDPKMELSRFDVVVAPYHDQTAGLNVLQTHGALNTITTTRLAQAHDDARELFAQYPYPRVGVLLGGKSGSADFNEQSVHDLGRRLKKLHESAGGSVLITPSRRTTPVLLTKLQSYLDDIPYYVWDGESKNPYMSILSFSDVLVVTEDSVSMVTEAAATGKPVYVAEAKSRSDKIEAFHRGLYDMALTRPFRGNWEEWTPKPLFEADAIARAVLLQQQKHADAFQAPARSRKPARV